MRYKHYLLGTLLVVFTSNGVDRTALGLVLQDIKVDLNLSDTQLGLLTGIAFALFYAVMGIPIARWADRGNRITIITLTTAMWSAAVALCGVATSFTQLLLIRGGVAIGEAGCLPPAHSLIADHFTRAERPRATAIYMLGAPLSTMLGYFLAGWLNELYGWRMTFVLLGLPGLAIAALVRFTLREPRQIVRPGLDAGVLTICASSDGKAELRPSIKEVCMALWRQKTFRHLLFFFVVAAFFAAGIVQWKAVFFIRSFGLQTGELGTWFAVIYGLGGLGGTYLGGELACRYAANNERLQLRAAALLYCAIGIIWTGVFLSPNPYLAFALVGLATVINGMTNGPIFAAIQTLVPERMRAMSIALLFLFANLIGMGIGPLAAGILSDALQSWAGAESIRYALLILSPGTLWCAWYLWRASASVTRDLALTKDTHAR